MKYLISLIIAGILGIANMMAETPIDMSVEPDDSEEQEDSDLSEKKELPDCGRRTPPARVRCTIDFATGTITGASAWIQEVEEYRILDAEGTTIIYTDVTESTFLTTLSQQPSGEYVIALRGSGYILRGSIEI